jgi:regulatory protein
MKNNASENSNIPEKKRRKITSSYLENSGAYYLERFSASTAQFTMVMTRKIKKSCTDNPEQDFQQCLSLLDAVIRKFTDLGYLNDKKFAENTIWALKNKGYPKSRIKLALHQKGVPKLLIEDCLSFLSDNHLKKAALTWVKRKRLGSFSDVEKPKDYQKSLSSMARAGFDFTTAEWALKLSREDIDIFMQEQS